MSLIIDHADGFGNMGWLDTCPEAFREKLEDILNYPPGSPQEARAFKYSDPGEYDGEIPPLTECESDEERKSLKARKVFAAAWGKYAEAMTAQFLLRKGLPLREWNWKPGPNSKGEIDLISQQGDTIIFIEVKARCGQHSDPWEAIDSKKIRNLCHGADIYLKQQKEFFKYRFDIALLTGSYDNFKFEYIDDAFLCPVTVRR